LCMEVRHSQMALRILKNSLVQKMRGTMPLLDNFTDINTIQIVYGMSIRKASSVKDVYETIHILFCRAESPPGIFYLAPLVLSRRVGHMSMAGVTLIAGGLALRFAFLCLEIS
jgi:hypothetical protein